MITSNRGDAPLIIAVLIGIVLLAVGVLGVTTEKKMKLPDAVPEVSLEGLGEMIGLSATLMGSIFVLAGVLLFVIAWKFLT